MNAKLEERLRKLNWEYTTNLSVDSYGEFVSIGDNQGGTTPCSCS